MSVLHHMQLEQVLPRLDRALRPGGVLAVAALPRWLCDHAVVMSPALTTRQVRQHATRLLPGAQVSRLIFWRYLLLWHKPGA